jgi:hypothetical protein
VLAIIGVAAVSALGYRTKSKWVRVSNKTFFDWLSILIVSFLLALGLSWSIVPRNRTGFFGLFYCTATTIAFIGST